MEVKVRSLGGEKDMFKACFESQMGSAHLLEQGGEVWGSGREGTIWKSGLEESVVDGNNVSDEAMVHFLDFRKSG
jgi:hypothetical protein